MDHSADGILPPRILQILFQIMPDQQTKSRVRNNVVVIANDRHAGPLAIIIAKDPPQAEAIKGTLSKHRGKLLNGHTMMCAWKGSSTYSDLIDKPIGMSRHRFDNGTYMLRITDIKPLWDILNEIQSS